MGQPRRRDSKGLIVRKRSKATSSRKGCTRSNWRRRVWHSLCGVAAKLAYCTLAAGRRCPRCGAGTARSEVRTGGGREHLRLAVTWPFRHEWPGALWCGRWCGHRAFARSGGCWRGRLWLGASRARWWDWGVGSRLDPVPMCGRAHLALAEGAAR